MIALPHTDTSEVLVTLTCVFTPYGDYHYFVVYTVTY